MLMGMRGRGRYTRVTRFWLLTRLVAPSAMALLRGPQIARAVMNQAANGTP